MSQTQPLCTPPATKRPGESLAAPAAVGQGECTKVRFRGHSGAGMVHMHMGRIPNHWHHITSFIAALPAQFDAAVDARSAAAAVAVSQAIPVGNHGDNRRSIK